MTEAEVLRAWMRDLNGYNGTESFNTKAWFSDAEKKGKCSSSVQDHVQVQNVLILMCVQLATRNERSTTERRERWKIASACGYKLP